MRRGARRRVACLGPGECSTAGTLRKPLWSSRDHLWRTISTCSEPRAPGSALVLEDRLGVQQGEFLTFDAVRQAARLVATAFGGKDDHTVAILADKRFNSARRRAKLPRWIARHIEPESLHLSTGMARAAASATSAMAQPADPVGESTDTAWLGPEDLALNGSVPLYQVKAKAAAEANSLAAAKLAAEAKAETKPLKLKLKVTRVKKEPVVTGDERTSVKRRRWSKWSSLRLRRGDANVGGLASIDGQSPFEQ